MIMHSRQRVIEKCLWGYIYIVLGKRVVIILALNKLGEAYFCSVEINPTANKISILYTHSHTHTRCIMTSYSFLYEFKWYHKIADESNYSFIYYSHLFSQWAVIHSKKLFIPFLLLLFLFYRFLFWNIFRWISWRWFY